jgi:hypothetical protein
LQGTIDSFSRDEILSIFASFWVFPLRVKINRSKDLVKPDPYANPALAASLFSFARVLNNNLPNRRDVADAAVGVCRGALGRGRAVAAADAALSAAEFLNAALMNDLNVISAECGYQIA